MQNKELLEWIEKAKSFIEMYARNDKQPLAIQLLEEYKQIEKSLEI